MSQIKSEKFQKFFEQAATTSVDAFKAEASYLEELVRRNTRVLSELAGARLTSLRDMAGAKTFSQAFESNLAFEEEVREELSGLHEDNLKAWEEFRETLKNVFAPVKKAALDVVPMKQGGSKPAAKKSAAKLKKKAPLSKKAA